MSLRKIAGLLAAFGLTVGLIGGGVGAVFSDQVTAQENISVGTFDCSISSASGTVVGKSLTYTAPPITSSAPGSAPLTFTVTNSGTIPAILQVSQTALPAPFSSILASPAAPVMLAGGASTIYGAGIQWAVLGSANEGASVSIKYTVDCSEVATPTVSFYSTNFGVYDGQNSVRFAGSGSGFTPGDPILVAYSWAAGGPWDLSSFWAILGVTPPVADANGTFTYWFADNCHNGHAYTTDEPVVVTATDVHGHSATGAGILACSLMP